MQYDDELYGKVEISERVLLDLLASDAMQRARGISQHGITALLGVTSPFCRFDHSVGAMLLVRRLGADIKEQTAALLHDVSHTAFSHVIDFVFDDHGGQTYHEEKKEEFLFKSDIPEILDRHGIDWREVMDDARFSLLEQPSPALCADRLDYFLRDLEFLHLANRREIRAVLDSLEVRDGRMVVNDPDVARWLGYTFIEADRASWSSFREVGLYQIAAEAIKVARKGGFIDEADIWGTDEALWEKLRSAEDEEVKVLIKLLSPGTRFVWNEEWPDFRVEPKVRSIDPLVVVGQSVQALSVLDTTFGQYRNDYMVSKQGAWPMSVIPTP